MDNFFKFLRQGLVATLFVMFTLTATYIPHNNTPVAEAGAATGGATVIHQTFQLVEEIFLNIVATAQKALQAASKFIANLGWEKEWTLDGIAWALAKEIISNMMQDLISWINSGFKGKPMFIQDIQGFLLETADRVAGEFIEELGGAGSFVCSPFRLDIQIALSLKYAETRDNGRDSTCTLTGIIDNIEGFLDGAQGSFSKGGWNDWFNVVSDPSTYTPYGAALSADKHFHSRIVNAKGEELTLVNQGRGFLSHKNCRTVTTPTGTKEDCDVVTPGATIQEALSANVDSERQSLVQADEVNEMFTALIGAIGNKLIGSASGLLGL